MKARIITGILLTALVISVVWVGPFWLVSILVSLAVLLAQAEFMALPGERMNRLDSAVGLAAGAAVLAAAGLSPFGSPAGAAAAALCAAGLVPLLLLWVLFTPEPIRDAALRASTMTTGLLYVALLGGSAILITRPEHGLDGRRVLLVVAAVTWLNDTMAFFGGKLLGRHRLYPVASPKKTWEGSMAGIAGAVAGAFAIRAIFGGDFSDASLAGFAVVGGALGQLGDLVESVFKRSYGVKDSGAILPGHGGMLDRIDAFLFVAPAGYAWFFLLAPHQ